MLTKSLYITEFGQACCVRKDTKQPPSYKHLNTINKKGQPKLSQKEYVFPDLSEDIANYILCRTQAVVNNVGNIVSKVVIPAVISAVGSAVIRSLGRGYRIP